MKIKYINTTTDCNITAKLIADSLVKNKLSPCVQIVQNIESIYAWKNKLHNSKEFLLIIKTLPEHVGKCKKQILDLHNYNIPEIIVTDGEILLDTYCDWFVGEVIC